MNPMAPSLRPLRHGPARRCLVLALVLLFAACSATGQERNRPARGQETERPASVPAAEPPGAPEAAPPTAATAPAAQPALNAQEAPAAQLVLLGTGTPNADPDRSGPSVAVVVGDRAYLVDAGPGVVRRAAQAARDLGIAALRVQGLSRVFITHLHSDHTVGLPDLLLTPWVLYRLEPLSVFGPPGTRDMMDHIVEAWAADIDIRVNGLEPRDANRDAYRPRTVEVRPGVVYQDERVTVRAFGVPHGSWQSALAYRFETEGRTIVISGDTAPSDRVVEACNGCDILLHEVYSAERFTTRPPEWQRYHASFHTSTDELAELAARARPGLLVLYHQLFWGTDDEGLVRELREAGYTGVVVSGRDLDVF